MIEVKAPGKLYIAGEYAVVNPGHRALLISVDKFIHVRIKKSNNRGSIKSYSNIKMIWRRRGDKIVLEQKDDRFEYIFAAMSIVEKYIKELKIPLQVYDIEVISDLESKDGIKYGLGSSAAVVVAIVKALLKFYNVMYSRLELFKLAVLANISISTSGSCGDIAAAVYNGIIEYRSFSRNEIKNRLNKDQIINIINSKWENLEIKEIPVNKEFKILVGWTKTPASSNLLVDNSRTNINNNLEFYNEFLLKSDKCVENLVRAYNETNFESLKGAIEENRLLLNEYAQKFNIIIENENLKKLVEIAKNYNLASKSSGAGGGDCGIAIANKSQNKDIVQKYWLENDIQILDLNIYFGEKDE